VSATVVVACAGADDPLIFDVTVREEKGETRHRVTLCRADLSRLGKGASPEATIEAAFRFLLDREPKESILGRFDISVVSHYFPQFEGALENYLPQ
jgi:hypothetical protein